MNKDAIKTNYTVYGFATFMCGLIDDGYGVTEVVVDSHVNKDIKKWFTEAFLDMNYGRKMLGKKQLTVPKLIFNNREKLINSVLGVCLDNDSAKTLRTLGVEEYKITQNDSDFKAMAKAQAKRDRKAAKRRNK